MALQLSQICDFCHKYRPVQHDCEFDKMVERAIEEHPELVLKEKAPIRKFETGATRDTDTDKYDYEGFLSPVVLEAYGRYMHKHRFLPNGDVRASDNWQKHFGENHLSVCIKSLWRHFMDLWSEHRGLKSREGIEDALMGILFNTMAYADKYLKDRHEREEEKISKKL